MTRKCPALRFSLLGSVIISHPRYCLCSGHWGYGDDTTSSSMAKVHSSKILTIQQGESRYLSMTPWQHSPVSGPLGFPTEQLPEVNLVRIFEECVIIAGKSAQKVSTILPLSYQPLLGGLPLGVNFSCNFYMLRLLNTYALVTELKFISCKT